MESSLKWMIWGYPYFRKPPYSKRTVTNLMNTAGVPGPGRPRRNLRVEAGHARTPLTCWVLGWCMGGKYGSCHQIYLELSF